MKILTACALFLVATMSWGQVVTNDLVFYLDANVDTDGTDRMVVYTAGRSGGVEETFRWPGHRIPPIWWKRRVAGTSEPQEPARASAARWPMVPVYSLHV